MEKELLNNSKIVSKILHKMSDKDYFQKYFSILNISEDILNVCLDSKYLDDERERYDNFFSDISLISCFGYVNNLPKYILLYIHYLQMKRIESNKKLKTNNKLNKSYEVQNNKA